MAVERGPDGSITNAAALTAADVTHDRVLCPICERKVFAMWPEGWDMHAAHKCRVAGETHEERKAAFKRQLRHLFR